MVLFTSRDQQLKHLPGATRPFILKPLDEGKCWSIIRAHTFCGDGIPRGCENLVEVGKKIAAKVQGSPLAAKAVGGMLRGNWDLNYWNRILDTWMGELPGVMEVLKLSYRHLLPHQRKCFAYCSLFPKGFEFHDRDVRCLGRMWVAQGFIQPGAGESMDEAGRKCFNDLLSRSFFQNAGRAYIMHDLMNDLARQVSQGDCLGVEGDNLPDGDIPETIRHISVSSPNHLGELSKRGFKFGNLRSFLHLCKYADDIDDGPLSEVLRQLRRIRVLHFENTGVKELPDAVGEWIHLRYLDIGFNKIESMPMSFWRLHHLQVLVAGNLSQYVELSTKVNNLTNLRILESRFSNVEGLSGIASVGRLTLLEALTFPFRVSKERGYEVGQLKDLDRIRGTLHIKNLENIESRQEVEAANTRGKRWLEALCLTWGIIPKPFDQEFTRYVPLPEVEGEELEALQPPLNLKRLKINGYMGSTCPSWMRNQCLSNLNTIHLKHLTGLVQLPPLGQLPNLQVLYMCHITSVRKLGGHEFYGDSAIAFPSLRKLVIEHMTVLEEWSGTDEDGSCFPHLHHLRMRDCPKLRSVLPLGQLKSLRVLKMRELNTITEICILDIGLLQNNLLTHNMTLEIIKCGELVSLGNNNVFPELMSRQTLKILDCPKLYKRGDTDTRR